MKHRVGRAIESDVSKKVVAHCVSRGMIGHRVHMAVAASAASPKGATP